MHRPLLLLTPFLFVTLFAATEVRAEKFFSITSEPEGAEITIDGQFDSSTSSKILLAPGEHTVSVMRLGYKAWERKITIETGAEKTVNALLERDDVRAGKDTARPQARPRP